MPASALEQMILELINRTRLDPAGEAARFGIDLNEGLSPNTLSGVSKQPLAMNESLLSAARAHSQDMIDRDYFDHNTPEGVTPFQRMSNAGYSFVAAAENIARSSTSGSVTTQMTLDLHQGLFVDAGIPGRGHRTNLLDNSYQEVGVGQITGNFQSLNTTMLTQDFARASSRQFITGVSYADTFQDDNFYSIGEGRNGMTVTVGASSVSTGAAGGYSLQVGTGVQNVTFSGGGLSAPISLAVTVLANTNAKVDVVDQNVIYTSASLTDLGGAATIIGLGTIGLTLTGDGGNDTIVGAKGNDTLNGGGGTDTAGFSGARSAYTISQIIGGVQITGPDGTDQLLNIENAAFSDQTIALGVGGQPPTITSNGGGDTASIFILENSSAVTVVSASDPDPGTVLTFAVSGGADASRFQIDAATGALSFLDPPDFESPSDAGANNSYIVQVSASDGSLADTQTITITVSNANDPGQALTGDGGANTLVGGDGSDTIDGAGGTDSLFGGLGSDVIFAGPGDDTANGGGGSDTILGQDGNDTVSGDSGDDRINGGLGNDVIFGGSGNDELGAGPGNDTIVGQDGNDVIFGEDGIDVANGGVGADIMLGGLGNDTFGGGDSNDILVGGDDDDLLFGEDGVDNINGEFGNDGVVGGSGDDILGGGAGDDIVVGDDGNDVLFGEIGNDAMNGGFGNDTLLGADGNDTLGGGAGGDDINGGFGNDTIFGENGDDILNGSAGNDVMIGGGNDDVFVFAPGDGADTIGDFVTGGPEDRIWFAGSSLHSFADVTANATEIAGNTVIAYNSFFSVTLNGVGKAQLTAGDFIFS